MTSKNPYQNLESDAFWKLAVAGRSMLDIENLWQPKFHIKQNDKIVTYGSCFAQHIGRALRARGFSWFSAEPKPEGLSAENAFKYHYDIFSSRTGNIYTASLLSQWIDWSFDRKSPPEEYWQENDRFYDPFRPNIEVNGFRSPEELLRSRAQAFHSFGLSVRSSDYFIFTLGLTECWRNKETNDEYPMCPGTARGVFEKEKHVFKNIRFGDALESLSYAFQVMRSVNPALRMILTVSPVPLTATYSGKHVLLATMESKSILRSVAGEMAENDAFVDYFPSYEIVNSPAFKGIFFEPNGRAVSREGVDFVMDAFFKGLIKKYGPYPEKLAGNSEEENQEICEEELLESFAKK